MANVKDLNRKISSLQNMQKVTRAMNMIATIKLRKLFSLQDSLMQFSTAVEEIVTDIRSALAGSGHPVAKGYDDCETENVVVFSADKGLCGSHNNSISKALALHIESLKARGITADVTSFGLKGTSFCRRKGYALYHQTEINDRSLTTDDLKKIAHKLYKRYRAGEIQSISLVYNRFINTLQQQTVFQPVLPLINPGDKTPAVTTVEIEPEPSVFLESAAELYLY